MRIFKIHRYEGEPTYLKYSCSGDSDELKRYCSECRNRFVCYTSSNVIHIYDANLIDILIELPWNEQRKEFFELWNTNNAFNDTKRI